MAEHDDSDALSGPDGLAETLPAVLEPATDARGLTLLRRLAPRLFDEDVQPVRIGRFAVLRTVGTGAMGVVHVAYDEVLDRRVAVKLIRSEQTSAEEGRARLLSEARAMARVVHPNVVGVYEAGEHAGGVFVAMEYVQGATLRDWLGARERSWSARLAVLIAAGRGLAAAHAAGIVHRDFKADHVLVGDDGVAKVGDFGLAGLGAAVTLDPGAGSGTEVDDRTDSAIGTSRSMSPEPFSGVSSDARSDQFSFCAVTYEALFGRRPFEGTTDAELRLAVTESRVVEPPASSPVPTRVRVAVMRGLSGSPKDRFESMDALLDALTPPPRHGGRTAAALVGGAGVLAMAWALQPDPACTGAKAHLEGVWDDTRRDLVGTRVKAAGAPFADATWSRLEPSLDDYAARWVAAHEQTCRATRVLGEQSEAALDLRMACLERRVVALGAAVDVLADGDASTLANADALVSDLPALGECDDAEALAATVPLPPADERDAVDAVHRQLARASAASVAGRYDESLEAANAAAELAAPLHYAPIASEVRLAQARGHAHLRQLEPTVEAANEALSLSLQHRQRRVAYHAAAILGHQLSVRQRRFDQARWVWDVARGLLSGIDDPRVTADFHDRYGNALLTEGRHDEAIAAYGRGLQAAGQLQDGPTLLTPSLRTHRAIAQLRNAQPVVAEAELRRAIDETAAVVGEQHPRIAWTGNQLSNALRQQGKLDAALRHSEAAAALGRATVPEHPFVAVYEMGVANVLRDAGETAKAADVMDSVMARWQPRLGDDDTVIVTARGNLAGVLADLGRYAEAEVHLRAVLDAEQRTLGDSHGKTAGAHRNLASILTMQGRHGEAEVEYRASLAGYEAALRPGNPKIATARAELAGNLSDQRRLDEAEAQLRLALQMLLGVEDDDSPRVAAMRNDLGNVLLLAGRIDDARTELLASLVVFERTRGPEHPHVARTLQTLAQLDMMQADWAGATANLRRAETIARSGDMRPAERAEVFYFLAVALSQTGADAERFMPLATEARTILEGAEGQAAAARKREVEAFIANPKLEGPVGPA